MKTKILSVWFAVLLVTPMWGQDAPVKKMRVYQDCAKNGAIKSSTGGIELGYAYVDLGLSVYWATCNIGATQPENVGKYYAWGEITEDTKYDWINYIHKQTTTESGYTSYNMKKYFSHANKASSSPDNKFQLEPMDDAAYRIMGGPWRMPTKAEWDELIANTSKTWTTVNNVSGCLFTSTVEGYSNNSIFIPVSGYYTGSKSKSDASYVYVWTSTLCSHYIDQEAYAVRCYPSDNTVSCSATNIARCSGIPIRPVLSK